VLSIVQDGPLQRMKMDLMHSQQEVLIGFQIPSPTLFGGPLHT